MRRGHRKDRPWNQLPINRLKDRPWTHLPWPKPNRPKLKSQKTNQLKNNLLSSLKTTGLPQPTRHRRLQTQSWSRLKKTGSAWHLWWRQKIRSTSHILWVSWCRKSRIRGMGRWVSLEIRHGSRLPINLLEGRRCRRALWVGGGRMRWSRVLCLRLDCQMSTSRQ